jgi:hypothetical protein
MNADTQTNIIGWTYWRWDFKFNRHEVDGLHEIFYNDKDAPHIALFANMLENMGAPDNPPWTTEKIAEALEGMQTSLYGIRKDDLHNLLASKSKKMSGIQLGFGSGRGGVPTGFDLEHPVCVRIFDESLKYSRTEWDFENLSYMGYDLVRLAINWRDYMLDEPPLRFRENNFNKLDRVIGWAEKHGVNIVLCLGQAPMGANSNPKSGNDGKNEYWTTELAQAGFAALWAKVADRYKDQDNIVGYDLMNEPEAPSQAVFEEEMLKLKNAIRAVDPNAVIVIEGNWWTHDMHWIDDDLLDEKTVMSLHFYWPGDYAVRGKGIYLGE